MADVVLVAAGDIATRNGAMDATAQLLDAHPGAVVLTLGDNAYDSGTAAEFESWYHSTWGRHKQRTWACPGNHDYRSAHVRPFPFFQYFGDRAGPGQRGYYSVELGDWHLVCLNSEIDRGPESAQLSWLRADLHTHRGKPTLAFFHKPRFSSGTHGSDRQQRHLWQTLCEFRTEIVLNGHEHHYERFTPQDGQGRAAAGGTRQFIVGTGGKELREVASQHETNSALVRDDTFGVLKLTLRPDSYDWQFLPIEGATFDDRGHAATNNH
jgi:acid phosphatase type 7